MSVLLPKYATEEDITIVLSSLANGTSVASSVIDNSTDKYTDYLVRYSVKTGPSGVSATGKIFFYAVGVIDDSGLIFPSDNIGGRLLGKPMKADANATDFVSNFFSVASAFEGKLPKFFKVVVLNDTGAALDSTEANHDKRAQGFNLEVI